MIKFFIVLLIKSAFLSYSNPKAEDIKHALYQFFPNPSELDLPSVTGRIQTILSTNNRHLLNIFSLDYGHNVAETIFKAIYAGMHHETLIL
jgi:hypothetical protein